MPIDSFEIAESPSPGALSREIELNGTNAAAELLTGLADLLGSAGWTLTATPAKAAIRWVALPTTYPRVPPVPEEDKETVFSSASRSIEIGDERWLVYDPEVRKAGDSHCIPMGYTVEESIANIAAALNNSAAWMASYRQYEIPSQPGNLWWEIILTAKTPGPLPNGTEVWVFHNWLIGAAVLNAFGGGYRMTSQAANGRTVYDIEMYQEGGATKSSFFPEDVAGPADHLMLKVIAEGGGAIYRSLSPQQSKYYAVANPYQLLVWGADATTFADWGDLDTAFLASAPWAPDDGSGKDCVVVLGLTAGPSYGNSRDWPNHLDWIRAQVSVEGGAWADFEASFADPGHPGMMLLRYPGQSGLTTPDGRMLLGNAWIALAPGKTSDARVVGKLWDAMTSSDAKPAGSSIYGPGNRAWLQVMRQEGSGGATRGALWIAGSF